jgi:hypothetical protein
MPGKRKRRQRFHVLLSVLYKRMRTDVMETVKRCCGEEKAVKPQHAQNILLPYNSLSGVLLDGRDMGLSIVQVKYPGAFSCFSCISLLPASLF